jgi:hypothetical protein
MDRRQSLKTIALGSLSAGLIVEACKTESKKTDSSNAQVSEGINRFKEEKEYEESLKNAPKFFTPEEMSTITVLADIIIPKDEVSGSASEAKVPEFIEFIVKDMPEHQTPMRGGLRWLDLKCLNLYGKPFTGCTSQQQIEMVEQIAYPKKAKPENQQGVAFFNLMRNLTATGFYSTEMGWKDVGYIGNTPNQWNGVPDDVLKQYKLAYTEKELKECISFDKA